MSAALLVSSLSPFTNLSGQALDRGYVYFGQPDRDPREHPVAVYFDEALRDAASQPLRTSSGFVLHNGAPASMWGRGDCSLLVLDSGGRGIHYLANWRGLSGSAGTFLQSGPAAVPRPAVDKSRETLSVEDFSFGSGAAAAIRSAIAEAASNGVGEVRFRSSEYVCDEPVLAENLRGIRLIGRPGQWGFAGTTLKGRHNGKATLSMVGSLFCELNGITIEGDQRLRPKTGLLLGRSSPASAGNHTIINVRVQGFYSLAGVYNIASEENAFINAYLVPNAAPVAALYMSQGDTFGVGGLVGSSMECNTFVGGTIGNADNAPGSTAVYLDCGAATGHHQFFGTFLTKHGGDSFITIRLGAVDGLDSTLPISFYNVVGEEGTTAPTYGLHFVSGTARLLAGFTAKNLRLEAPASQNIHCDGGGAIHLIGADISTPWRASKRAPSTFQRVSGSRLSLLGESRLNIEQLSGTELVVAGATVMIASDLGANVVRDSFGGTPARPLTGRPTENQVLIRLGPRIAIDASQSNNFAVLVTSAIRFVIEAPVNASPGQRITIRIQNNSGAPMGGVAWADRYKLAPWSSPASGFSRSIDFRFNGTHWVEVSRTPSDVPI